MILSDIQKKLKVGKSNRNEFGKYNYRTCSDILEAVKPLLPQGWAVMITDTVVQVGDRIYVKAEATLTDGKASFVATAFAREEETKKGMDASQITGAASSYARKYALNGLFAIDDTADADSHEGEKPYKESKKEEVITQEQFETLANLIMETASDANKFCEACGVKQLKDLSASGYARALSMLETKKARMK